MSKLHWSALILILSMLGGLWIYHSRLPEDNTNYNAPPSPREGFSAPDFTLDLLDGGQVKLSNLRGKVVMINFWATWCPPCRAEMPAIEKVYRAYKDLGLEVLAVNLADQENGDVVITFVHELGLTFAIPLDKIGAVSAAYTLQGLPSTYFIDHKGIIRTVIVGGPMNEALIQSKVEELIKELP